MRRLHESRRLPLSVLIAAHAVSLLGNTVALVAIPWFVLSTTGSAARTGIAFFATLPVAAGSLFAGPLTDLLGARRTSVFSDTLSAVSIAAIPLLYAADALSFWALAGLVFRGRLVRRSRTGGAPDLAPRARQAGHGPAGARQLAVRSHGARLVHHGRAARRHSDRRDRRARGGSARSKYERKRRRRLEKSRR